MHSAVEIIARKRDGHELPSAAIRAFVRGLTDGSIPDYQAAAWLMAVFLRGMTPRETLDLTLAMRDSGATIDLSDLPGGPTLDKHSTGGVGDKTTLVVAPILAAAGVPILKMSGRGLGFAGGTVDKLESLPGFRTNLTIAEAKAQVRQIGAALIAQSDELAPADRILYHLRDVTATVESLPLIASSIMSKKLAAGAARIVLDVKVGRGAYLKTLAEAEALAQAMIAIGNGAGIPTSALLTAMEEPLGRSVGNALEVEEALEALRPGAALPPATARFRELCVALAAHGLAAVGKAARAEDGRQQAQALLESGAARRKFLEIVAAQGGPSSEEALREALRTQMAANRRVPVTAEQSGTVATLDAEAVGRLAMQLGAGRERHTDAIDPAAGILLNVKTGDRVQAGDTLGVLSLAPEKMALIETFAAELRAAYTLLPPDATPPTPSPLVLASL